MDFDIIWNNILCHEGETFYTQKKLPFTYKIIDNCVVTDRTDFKLAKTNFIKAAAIENLTGPGQISKIVMGSSYVFAILKDSRI